MEKCYGPWYLILPTFQIQTQTETESARKMLCELQIMTIFGSMLLLSWFQSCFRALKSTD